MVKELKFSLKSLLSLNINNMFKYFYIFTDINGDINYIYHYEFIKIGKLILDNFLTVNLINILILKQLNKLFLNSIVFNLKQFCLD